MCEIVNWYDCFVLCSIARACYADADVYLMDDPLAAVDAHVASHLLSEVFGRGGLLGGRTRLMATHHPSAIAAADRVAVLEGGRLVEFGSYVGLTGRPTSRLNAFLRSKELRERLLSEESATTTATEAVIAAATAMPDTMVRRRRTLTGSISSSAAVPGDLE